MCMVLHQLPGCCLALDGVCMCLVVSVWVRAEVGEFHLEMQGAEANLAQKVQLVVGIVVKWVQRS